MFDTETIASIISALSSLSNKNGKLIWSIVDLIQEKAGFAFVAIHLVDSSGEFLVMKSGTGLAGKLMIEKGSREYTHPKPEIKVNPLGDTVYFNQVQILDYCNSFASPDVGVGWQISFPLRQNNDVIGVLEVEGDAKISFRVEETYKFQRVADEVSRLLVRHSLV